ncbi:MAG: hypothetical protein KAW19_07725 [Candidatus Aminicenantes bacterium]|nr:hypothetical protein [Candidatus Aminicenantes bacterium]
MNIRKTIALMGSLMILGAGLIFAEDTTQKAARNVAKNMVKLRFQVRTLFVDENGDGICDFANDFRDHDNDGIPNGQDSDWARPQDGKGYQGRNGNMASSNQFRNRHNFRVSQFGSGICDGKGPKGLGNRRGGR